MTEVKLIVGSPEQAAILIAVLAEMNRAQQKHPKWPSDIIYMDQIINEEKGEATRAAVQYVMEGGSISELKTELVQTAATILRMLNTINDYSETL